MADDSDRKEKLEDLDDPDVDQYFDAQSVLVDRPQDSTSTPEWSPTPEPEGWDIVTMINKFNKLVPQKTEEKAVAGQPEQLIIKIKDEHKRELHAEEEEPGDQLVVEEDPNAISKKGVKLTIVSGAKTGKKSNQTEVTVVNEDDILIDSNDIEMNTSDQTKFLFNLILVLILDLFIISTTAHWIYNYLEGLDWKLELNTYFNFHIFFMTLGISAFGIGMLVHRMFRGMSSGALKCIHTFLTLTSLIFFVIGIYAAILSLQKMGSAHFYSVHSWMGMLSILTFLTSWLSAFIIYIFPRFIDDIQTILAPIHSFFGRLVFTLICATAVSGLCDKLRISDTEIDLGPINPRVNTNSTRTGDTRVQRITFLEWKIPDEVFLCNLMAIAILFFAVFVNYLSSNESYKRRLLPEEQGIEIKSVAVK